MTSALDEELKLEEDLARDRAQSGLLAFTQAMYGSDYRVSWHHRAICRAVNYMEARRTPRELLASFGIKGRELQRQLSAPHPVTGLYAGLTHPSAVDRPLRNLQVHVPPQFGKSELISRHAPAWMLGRDPDRRIVCASYSAKLSRLMGRAVTKVIESPAYHTLFPKTRLAGAAKIAADEKQQSYVKNSDLFEVMGRRGMYKNAGVGGSLTGFSADVAIIDDAVRNRQDADSAVIRRTLHNWYQSVMYTRLSRDPAQIIINTRFHERDLSGWTLAQARANPLASQWFCLIFPASLDCDPSPGDPRRKHGEALWEHKATAHQLTEIRNTISAYEWNSLYQQRPSPPEGGIVKISWFKYYEHLPQNLSKFTLSADLTFGDRSDYMVLQVWAQHGADHYLVDRIKDRLPFTGQLRAFRSLCAKYPQIKMKLVEDAANGAALIDTVKREISGVIGVRAVGSKEMRLDAVSPMIEAGNVFLPSPQRSPWVDEMLNEIAAFPTGAHDDEVDAMSQYLSRVQKRHSYGAGAVPIGFGKVSYWNDE
ncbi:MAG: hypothetical protein EOO38_06280 [Cytophagaceae bacterium]|nr:MAG: hypothetical protein EOO38_06280 [Cytophagaceae bacterium]